MAKHFATLSLFHVPNRHVARGCDLAPRISLEPVTESNFEAVVALEVSEDQRGFVSSNTRSLAQAYVYEGAEPYAIRSGRDLIGFTMLYPLARVGEPSTLNLVRFMIDQRYQGQGLGRRALEALIAQVRRRPEIKVIQLSVYPDNEAAIRLYESVGFKDTGQMAAGEKVYRLRLRSA